ncbi:hypothetical protein FLJC2902T_24860 [Flavobacterium limnosediminis JC2902]|uniref:Outer membrane protein beta-barrel domain-containing protein n=1 Tax=Flavobacterium limnosediminis JC2902 TaxID=1341181 RepID=V6SQ09_9FLAO|nr:outer membrane beta-barrel protein [Flavobacterium limnosediminis]ESU26515.1 hypothetical protein FLJC2902T_24860 [Flavobacterium limnosediminis JC2902]
MNKTAYLIIILFISSLINAQTKFEKGSYIDSNNIKIEGFIKNEDWRNNPKEFEFKENENGTANIISIDNAKEFEITGINKYVRADVDIERSSNKLGYLGTNKDPQYVNERLFLKQIVFGTSNLFKYEENGLEKFFYSVNNSPVKQLIFIKYSVSSENNPEGKYEIGDMLTNDLFRRQLWMDVKCETTTQNDIKSTDYNTSDLTKYFKNYNSCKGDKPVTEIVEKKVKHNLKASGIYNIATMDVEHYSPSTSPNFKNSSFGFGLEYELLLPFNNNKWGVIFEPSYNTFKDEQTLPPYGLSTINTVAKTDMSYIQLPFGIRYYFFLDSNSKIFVNAIANVRLIGEKENIDFNTASSDLSYSPSSFSPAFGLGYTYKKISGEFRYYLESGVSAHPNIPINYTNSSFILRYELFGRK